MPIFIRIPISQQEWPEIVTLFEKRWNCPHALGVMVGKHATIRKPKSGSSFFILYIYIYRERERERGREGERERGREGERERDRETGRQRETFYNANGDTWCGL